MGRGRRKKTHEEFLEQIKDRPFIALEPYKTAHEKIRFKCSVPDCLHEWSVTPNNILSGHGCHECARRYRIKTNEILAEDNGVVLIDISTPTHTDAMMLVDSEVWNKYLRSDGGRVSAEAWGRTKYIYAGYSGQGRRTKRFHHFVLAIPSGMEIDHITHGNMSYIDNTRTNLRICTRSQNCRNQSVRADNKSGVTGVCWATHEGKWKAYIIINRKTRHIGCYDSKAEAITARKEAEKTYFGEYAFHENNI